MSTLQATRSLNLNRRKGDRAKRPHESWIQRLRSAWGHTRESERLAAAQRDDFMEMVHKINDLYQSCLELGGIDRYVKLVTRLVKNSSLSYLSDDVQWAIDYHQTYAMSTKSTPSPLDATYHIKETTEDTDTGVNVDDKKDEAMFRNLHLTIVDLFNNIL